MSTSFIPAHLETGRLALSTDWSQHPLGPVERWPQSLKTAVGVMLHSSFPMFISWGERRTLIYNDAYAVILGKKHPQAFGAEFQKVWAEIWPAIEPLVKSVDRGGSEYQEDLELVMNRFGYDETTYFTFSYSPIFDEGGRVSGLFCAVVETTQRKKSEDALRKAEESLKIALSSAQMGVWEYSLVDGRVVFSEDAARIFGVATAFSSLKSAFDSFIHPDDRDATERSFLEALHNATPYSGEFRVVRADGAVRWVNSRGRAHHDANGQAVGIAGLVLDVTERRQAEEDLREALRARDDFLSIASHELKTPLTSLQLQTQLLNRQIARGDQVAYSKPRVDQLATQTDKQVRRLLRLVDDMLDVARIRSGNLTLVRERFDLGELVRESVSRLQAQFVEAGCGEPRVTAEEPVLGEWDRMRVEQVLNNLLTNALRYGRGTAVEVAVSRVDGGARVIVKDHGIGIAKGAHAKIFDRFERAVDAKEVSGLGLGLFISRQIVVAHGGSIRVESEPGQGASFIVELPVAPARSESARAV